MTIYRIIYYIYRIFDAIKKELIKDKGLHLH